MGWTPGAGGSQQAKDYYATAVRGSKRSPEPQYQAPNVPKETIKNDLQALLDATAQKQNQTITPKITPKPEQHKFETALNALKAAGKGNTSQANVYKNYLYGVKTAGGNNAYFEWLDKAYPSGPLDIKGQPDIYNWGEYDMNAPMSTGYGSVFGASSGALGKSNVAVTDTLKFMMEDYINQGYEREHAAQKAFKKFYVDSGVDYANFMGDRDLPYSQQPAVQDLLKGSASGGGGDGGGPGGWGDSWGAGGDYSGGGGGGGGYGYAEEDFTPRGNPNEAWGQQNPLQQAMISIHGGQGFQQGFARGGIVSLVT